VWAIIFASGLALAEEPAEKSGSEQVKLSQFWGFGSLEIFKLEPRSANMLARDLNQDGRTDLILVDNSHSRIDVLLQRDQKPADTTDEVTKQQVNFLEDDWRFKRVKIPVDKEISSLAVGDFNSDGKTDIAYFSPKDHLIVRRQTESGVWSKWMKFRVPDVPEERWNMAAGDLNSDGRDDFVLLGNNATYVAYQQADGELPQPTEIMNTSEKLKMAQIADLDGDGRNDLCYVANDAQEGSLCARLQGIDNRLGPELRFDLREQRSVSLANVDGQPGEELLTVDGQTGRVKVLQLRQPKPESGELAGRLIQYGFGQRGTGRDRDLATGDLDGDGLIDVVVTDPDAAQMIVFGQHQELGLDLGNSSPGLVGASQVRIADLDGDRAAEVIVLSTREKTLGLSRLRSGRLSFPVSLPVENDPVAFELADLDGDGDLEIVTISRTGKGRSSKYALRALAQTEQGGWEQYAFGKKQQSVPIALKETPRRLVTLDANGNSRPDFLLFTGLERQPHLLGMSEEGIPSIVPSQSGIRLGDVASGAVFIGELDGPAILAAQKNFARNLQLDEEGKWQVIDQYNAPESTARISGVATIDLDDRPGNEVVLIDTGIDKLRVLRNEEGVFRPWREVEMGALAYKSAHVADLNGDAKDDLLLFGRGKFAVLYSGRSDSRLHELASFETKLEDVYFSDVVAGDLNADGHVDLAAVDTRSHYIEILDNDSAEGVRHAIHFKVFEEKNFTRDEGYGSEPREVLISDVTSDGRPDLVLLAHDRVLVYPQDDAE
jgi:hypothetical protein